MAVTLTPTNAAETIYLSQSPIIYNIAISGTSDVRKAVVLNTYHGEDLIGSVEIPMPSDTLTVDISSAIHGWFISKKYDCASLAALEASVNVETFTIKVDYKGKNGSTFTLTPNAGPDTTVYAVEGKLSEWAIYEHGATSRLSFGSLAYSLKPQSMECVNYEEVPLLHLATPSSSSTPSTPSTAEGSRPYFAEEYHNSLRRTFYFINSLGMLESASAVMRESSNYATTTSVMKLYKEPSFGYDPQLGVSKTQKHTWKMSSGYCTQEWADWWAQEFCMAKHHWMVADDKTLLPVTIDAGSSMTVYDRAKGDLPHIDFTVRDASC